MSTQIVYAAHTPSRVWDELNAHATQTRIRLEARCPACAGELKYTHRDVCCDACDTSVSFFQQRHLSDDADTRVIYIHVNGHEKEIHRLDLCCLSCEERLNAEELCPNICEIQTFLILEIDAGKLYAKRSVVNPLYNEPRPTTEIPIRQTLEHSPIGDTSQESDTIDTTPQKAILPSQPSQPIASSVPRNPVESETDGVSRETDVFQTPTRTNEKKDIEGQILELLPQDGTPMRAAEIKKSIDGNHRNMYGAINRLIEKGRIVNPQRGLYARRG